MIDIKDFTGEIQGWLTPDEGQLLADIAGKCTIPIVEIGSWKGRSTCWILYGSKNSRVFAVDHFKGSAEHKAMYGKDIDTYAEFLFVLSKFHEEFKPTSDLCILRMDSYNAAGGIPDESIGMVFIDGSHDYESVKLDVDSWFPKLIEDGWILFHDNNFGDIKQFLEELKKSDKFYNWQESHSISYAQKRG